MKFYCISIVKCWINVLKFKKIYLSKEYMENKHIDNICENFVMYINFINFSFNTFNTFLHLIQQFFQYFISI